MLLYANMQHNNILLIMNSGKSSQKNNVLLEEIHKIILLCDTVTKLNNVDIQRPQTCIHSLLSHWKYCRKYDFIVY